ncbi:hypothetical protein KY360_06730 [Candidatus Woesearchaeota archaeon]|nr:hypothetical protein [Candidatus Woesearchaeota archaeon]
MRKLDPGHIIKFSAVVVALVFFVVAISLNQIKSEILQLISVYGYIAVFITTLMVESLAQPIGPELSLLSGKIMGLNMVYSALITLVASVTASFINYRIGRMFHHRAKGHKAHPKYLKWYKKHGKYGLLVAALGPVPYVPFCWFSGAFGLSVREFVYFGILPRIGRLVVVSYLIHLFL